MGVFSRKEKNSEDAKLTANDLSDGILISRKNLRKISINNTSDNRSLNNFEKMVNDAIDNNPGGVTTAIHDLDEEEITSDKNKVLTLICAKTSSTFERDLKGCAKGTITLRLPVEKGYVRRRMNKLKDKCPNDKVINAIEDRLTKQNICNPDVLKMLDKLQEGALDTLARKVDKATEAVKEKVDNFKNRKKRSGAQISEAAANQLEKFLSRYPLAAFVDGTNSENVRIVKDYSDRAIKRLTHKDLNKSFSKDTDGPTYRTILSFFHGGSINNVMTDLRELEGNYVQVLGTDLTATLTNYINAYQQILDKKAKAEQAKAEQAEQAERAERAKAANAKVDKQTKAGEILGECYKDVDENEQMIPTTITKIDKKINGDETVKADKQLKSALTGVKDLLGKIQNAISEGKVATLETCLNDLLRTSLTSIIHSSYLDALKQKIENSYSKIIKEIKEIKGKQDVANFLGNNATRAFGQITDAAANAANAQQQQQPAQPAQQGQPQQPQQPQQQQPTQTAPDATQQQQQPAPAAIRKQKQPNTAKVPGLDDIVAQFTQCQTIYIEADRKKLSSTLADLHKKYGSIHKTLLDAIKSDITNISLNLAKESAALNTRALLNSDTYKSDSQATAKVHSLVAKIEELSKDYANKLTQYLSGTYGYRPLLDVLQRGESLNDNYLESLKTEVNKIHTFCKTYCTKDQSQSMLDAVNGGIEAIKAASNLDFTPPHARLNGLFASLEKFWDAVVASANRDPAVKPAETTVSETAQGLINGKPKLFKPSNLKGTQSTTQPGQQPAKPAQQGQPQSAVSSQRQQTHKGSLIGQPPPPRPNVQDNTKIFQTANQASSCNTFSEMLAVLKSIIDKLQVDDIKEKYASIIASMESPDFVAAIKPDFPDKEHPRLIDDRAYGALAKLWDKAYTLAKAEANLAQQQQQATSGQNSTNP